MANSHARKSAQKTGGVELMQALCTVLDPGTAEHFLPMLLCLLRSEDVVHS
jgi:hypothetical protein